MCAIGLPRPSISTDINFLAWSCLLFPDCIVYILTSPVDEPHTRTPSNQQFTKTGQGKQDGVVYTTWWRGSGVGWLLGAASAALARAVYTARPHCGATTTASIHEETALLDGTL